MNPRVVLRVIALATVVGAMLVATSACKSGNDAPRVVSYDLVKVFTDKQYLRHDTVGAGRFESQATFVLVDVENLDVADLEVSLGGELVDGNGAKLSVLRVESLRIPPGSRRVFALIDVENKKREQAVRANVRIVGVQRSQHPSPVQITTGQVSRDGDRVVANAYAVNTSAERLVRVIVLGAFYRQDGVPLTRPFVDVRIPAGETHPIQFVGPSGSRAASIFVGEMAY